MATFNRLEDIESWKMAREISKEIYKVCRKSTLSKEFGLCNQVKNSSGSMMDNIAEGFGRDGNKEFIQFLSIGKDSANELKSQLYRVCDNSFITEMEFEELYNKADKYAKMVASLIQYLNETSIKGVKYKNRKP